MHAWFSRSNRQRSHYPGAVMKYLTWDHLFPANRNKRQMKLRTAEWKVLEEDSWFEGYSYAKGSRYKVWEGKDFGYVAFHPTTRTPDGHIPARLWHKY